MAVFAVIGHSNPDAVKAAVVGQYGANHYEFTANVWLVTDAGSTKDVADKLGITNGQLGSTAVVLQFSGYSGWANAAAWTWLQHFPEARPNG